MSINKQDRRQRIVDAISIPKPDKQSKGIVEMAAMLQVENGGF